MQVSHYKAVELLSGTRVGRYKTWELPGYVPVRADAGQLVKYRCWSSITCLHNFSTKRKSVCDILVK